MYNKINIDGICKNRAKRLLGLGVHLGVVKGRDGVVNCRYGKGKSAGQQARNGRRQNKSADLWDTAVVSGNRLDS